MITGHCERTENRNRGGHISKVHAVSLVASSLQYASVRALLCNGTDEFILMFQGYLTGPGAILPLPQASEVTLRNVGKEIRWNH